MSKKKTNQGFTLAELLITIFIISFISTMLVVNWRTNEKQYAVQRAAQSIIQSARRVQDMALSGKKSSDSQHPASYGIHFDSQNTNSYILYGDMNGNDPYQPSDILIETVFLDSDIEIYALSSHTNLDVAFTIPDGFAMINYHGGNSDSDASVDIRIKGVNCPSNYCKSIIIKDTGEISIQ